MSRHWPFNKMASEKDRHLYSSGLCFISLCKRMCFLRTCIDINWVQDHFLPNDLIFWYRSLFCRRLYFKLWAIIGIGDLKEWFSSIMVRTTAVSTNKRQLVPMLISTRSADVTYNWRLILWHLSVAHRNDNCDWNLNEIPLCTLPTVEIR